MRVIVANAESLAKKRDAISRFMQGYRETIEYMYGDNPQVMTDYAKFVGVPEELAKKARADFFPRSLVNPDEIKGVDALMADAVQSKFIPAPLTNEQLAELIQIQQMRKPGWRFQKLCVENTNDHRSRTKDRQDPARAAAASRRVLWRAMARAEERPPCRQHQSGHR